MTRRQMSASGLASESDDKPADVTSKSGSQKRPSARSMRGLDDLTSGTGRFNLTLGAIATAVGIGAALSQTIAGAIVHHFSDRAGFLFLAAVAGAAFVILWLFMPETLDWKGDAVVPTSMTKP